jgi:ABC-2 type transport system ATP-binding protein
MGHEQGAADGQPATLAGVALGGAAARVAAPPPAARAEPAPVVVDAPAAFAGEPVVLLENVGKRFGEFQAVEGLDLQVPPGGLVGLIGPSGCGKTTTIRLLLGVYEPTTGKARVFGRPSHRLGRGARARIGYLPQQFVLYPTLSVEENLNFAAAAYGLGPWRRRRHKRDVLALVGLTEHRKKLARDISGGMLRRLSLAATLLHQPDLLFLDEPTAGIDPILREQLWAEFRRLQIAGRTQLVTTQYVAEAEYCDTVVLMDGGRIVAAGPPERLRQEAAGGDLVDATIPDFDRVLMLQLRNLRGVRSVEYRGDQQVRLVVEDAGEMIPQIMGAVQTAGAEVREIEERRLSFNEVFVALLKRAGRDVGEVRGDE